jgi:hypothetical protein
VNERWRQINRVHAHIRVRGEHAFHVGKPLWGLRQFRYGGVAKNTARAFARFALAILYVMRHRLRSIGVTRRQWPLKSF